MPVALVKANTLYYVHTDHLGTPRSITNSANAIVWKWNNTDPFGANLPATQTVEYNKRFPGQYFDNESKLHYNYYRTYNPLIGRYIQSDPLGLAAGFNTYSYVGSNPLGAVDPLGLDVWIEGSSYSEPGAHLSISVGNSKGAYRSFSFGIGDCPNGRTACVYEDDSLLGQINKMLSATPEQDQAIIKDLLDLSVKDNKKIYLWDYTCRGYSQEKFDYFKRKYNLKEKSFTPRKYVPRNWENFYGLIVSSSSTTILWDRFKK